MLAKRKHEYTAAELIDGLRGLPVSGDDLRRLVFFTQEMVAEELQRRVTAFKASRDGSGLPAETLARDLVRGQCHCEAALRWTKHE